jgi:hypothetical protein
MALDATEVRLGVTGNLYKAPVGTAMPTDVTAALAVAWKELGYTETGPSMSVDASKEQFTPWQAVSPVREVVTSQMVTATFTLWQRNAETLKLAWGGGTVTGTTTKIFTPPAVATVSEGAFVFEIVDGTVKDRYLIPRASISLAGEVSFAKDAVTGYEIELTFLQPATGSAWTLLTNDAKVPADA